MTIITNNFLASCPKLTSIDLTPIGNSVQTIQSSFLKGAAALTAVHLPFTGVLTHIANDFMSGCLALQTLTVAASLHEAKSVESVGDGFLKDCATLTAIDMTFLSNVQQIGTTFLQNCASIKTLDTTVLGRVNTIGQNFLTSCDSLEEVDLAVFQNIKQIGDYTLGYCGNLRRVYCSNTTGCGCVSEIGANFLCDATSLQSLELWAFSNVTKIGQKIMSGVGSIQRVDLSAWKQLSIIGNSFLANSTVLSLTLPNAPPNSHTAVQVAADFLYNCHSLAFLDLRFFANVTNTFLAASFPRNLKLVVVPPPKTITRSFVERLPQHLQSMMITCQVDPDGESASNRGWHLQWSWKHHDLHSRGAQLAVLWVFAGLQYVHGSRSDSLRSESRCLPSEVSYEICRFIGTPPSEILPPWQANAPN